MKEKTKEQTVDFVGTILAADPSITPEHRERIIRECRKTTVNTRLLTTVEACRTLDPDHPPHPVTLRRYEKRGLLRPVRYSARYIRWPESQILALRSGVKHDSAPLSASEFTRRGLPPHRCYGFLP